MRVPIRSLSKTPQSQSSPHVTRLCGVGGVRTDNQRARTEPRTCCAVPWWSASEHGLRRVRSFLSRILRWPEQLLRLARYSRGTRIAASNQQFRARQPICSRASPFARASDIQSRQSTADQEEEEIGGASAGYGQGLAVGSSEFQWN